VNTPSLLPLPEKSKAQISYPYFGKNLARESA
jgi:hypothetical protein